VKYHFFILSASKFLCIATESFRPKDDSKRNDLKQLRASRARLLSSTGLSSILHMISRALYPSIRSLDGGKENNFKQSRPPKTRLQLSPDFSGDHRGHFSCIATEVLQPRRFLEKTDLQTIGSVKNKTLVKYRMFLRLSASNLSCIATELLRPQGYLNESNLRIIRSVDQEDCSCLANQLAGTKRTTTITRTASINTFAGSKNESIPRSSTAGILSGSHPSKPVQARWRNLEMSIQPLEPIV